MAYRNKGPKMRARIINVYRKQVEIPTLVRDLRAFVTKHWGAKVAVEAIGAFKAVPQLLREQDPTIRLIEVNALMGDKFMRAQGLAAAWNQGRVEVPQGSPPWLKPYLSEMQDFTGLGDAEDDQVDGSTLAWNCVAGAPKGVQRGSVAEPGAY
jgi:predicted phage terminase large subunit-like protein